MKRSFLQWLNLIALLAMIVINALANALPFNGVTTGEVSDQFDSLFVPAGFTFSIWAVIYLALSAFAIYQFLPSQRDNPRIQAIDYTFAWSCLANSAWLFFWHYGIFHLTVVAMLSLLFLLITIYMRIRKPVGPPSNADQWFIYTPFSLYLAWISVATIANVTDFLLYLGWDGGALGPEVWAVIMIIIATGITMVAIINRHDLPYTLVMAWAFIGIAYKQQASLMVRNAALIGATLVLLFWLGIWLWRSYHRRAIGR